MTLELLRFKRRKSDLSGEIEVLIYNHNNAYLGYISFHKRWNTWVFHPDEDTFYDSRCLSEIIAKIVGLPKSKPRRLSDELLEDWTVPELKEKIQ